jgi:nucleoid-associated protein YgaU
MAGANPPKSVVVGGAGAAVVVVVAAFFALQPAPEPVPAPPAPVVVSAPEPSPAPVPRTEVELRFAIVPSPDGIVTLAGTAPPGLPISIRLDGVEMDRLASIADGSFATVLDLPPAALPRVLTVAAILPDGTEILSQDTGFLPPTAVVAAVEPAPEPTETIAPIVVSEAGTVVADPLPTGMPASQVTLDAITYPSENIVQFSGKGQPGAFVRLYLDGEFLMESGVRAEGQWFAESPDISPGTYLLRIDQIETAGEVASRFETPFLRETQEALAVAAAPAEPAPAAAPDMTAPPIVSLPPTVIVQPGLTLWAIAEAEFGDGVAFVQVFEANRDKIRDPDLIYPGQIFTIPKSD